MIVNITAASHASSLLSVHATRSGDWPCYDRCVRDKMSVDFRLVLAAAATPVRGRGDT